MALIFAFYRFEMRSAGALSALVTGMALRTLCDAGRPSWLSSGPNLEHAQQVGASSRALRALLSNAGVPPHHSP